MHKEKGASVAGSVKDAVFILLGILSAGFGLKGFLLSSHFIDGGVTGVSMLLASVFGWPLYLSIPIINLPFIAAGYWLVSRAFAVKSALAMAGGTRRPDQKRPRFRKLERRSARAPETARRRPSAPQAEGADRVFLEDQRPNLRRHGR